MPYIIVETEENEEDKYCVYKKDSDGNPVGDTFGCHANHGDAVDQIVAIAMSEQDESKSKSVSSMGIKSLGENRFGAYGVLWGDESKKDLAEEYFDENTEDLLAIFDAMKKIPYCIEHAGDDRVKKIVAAEVDVMEKDSKGVWWEAKVIDHEAYVEYVKPLIDRGVLYSSSGTLPAARRVNKSGRITRWPIVEMTGTTTPCEWRMLETPIELIEEHYKSIGLKFLEDQSESDTSEAENRDIEKMYLKAKIKQSKLNLQLLETTT